jgi:putative PIN family toxin of toxin-antitoxin system
LHIVFDTNVYISAFGVPGSKASSAYGLAEVGVFDLAVSPQILEEMRLKLGGPKFGFSDARVDQVEELIREFATLVEPEMRLSVLEDEPDNRILECAWRPGR